MFVLQNIFVYHNFPNAFLAINWEYIHLFWTNPDISISLSFLAENPANPCHSESRLRFAVATWTLKMVIFGWVWGAHFISWYQIGLIPSRGFNICFFLLGLHDFKWNLAKMFGCASKSDGLVSTTSGSGMQFWSVPLLCSTVQTHRLMNCQFWSVQLSCFSAQIQVSCRFWCGSGGCDAGWSLKSVFGGCCHLPTSFVLGDYLILWIVFYTYPAEHGDFFNVGPPQWSVVAETVEILPKATPIRKAAMRDFLNAAWRFEDGFTNGGIRLELAVSFLSWANYS